MGIIIFYNRLGICKRLSFFKIWAAPQPSLPILITHNRLGLTASQPSRCLVSFNSKISAVSTMLPLPPDQAEEPTAPSTVVDHGTLPTWVQDALSTTDSHQT